MPGFLMNVARPSEPDFHSRCRHRRDRSSLARFVCCAQCCGWDHATTRPEENRRIAAARRRRALAPLRDLKATLIGHKGEAGLGWRARLRLPTLHDVVLEDDLGVTQIDRLVRAGTKSW